MSKELFKRILSSVIVFPLALFFIIKGKYFFLILISFCFIVISYEWYLLSKCKKYSVPGYIFLIFSFFTIYKLRNNLGNDEYLQFIFVTFVCILTDIGGYFFGKIFKGPKLTRLSPNKTYSGMVGSYLFSLFFIFILFSNNVPFLNSLNFSINLFFSIVLISTISQLGDLIISYFKRLSKIKDTGNILPGHGGLLDRFDGMIFAFPFSYVMFQLNIFYLN